MQVVEAKDQRITPGFTLVRDLIKEAGIYGMSEDAVLALIQTGTMEARALSCNGKHWLPVVDPGHGDCYVKESDAMACLGALQKMVLYEKKYCRWKTTSAPFDTETELCSIYLPSIVKYDPYLPRNIIDGCMDLCENDLNSRDVVEVVFHSEEEREQSLLYDDFGAYISPDHADVVVGAYAAFNLSIRLRNTGIAKQHQYYPVRYVHMDLPE